MGDRREFLRAGLALGAGYALGGAAWGRERDGEGPPAGAPNGKKLRVLILGGTGFLGPATVKAALARGHSVTIFNRGKTEKRRPLDGEGVVRLLGNRDPEKRADDADESSAKGLESLRDGAWDVVIDNSGYYPRHVKASAELLASRAERYIFVSTVSVYATHGEAYADETGAVGTLADESVEEMGRFQENYGPLKALCERAAEAAMPGRVASVRPGFIVGPGDPTDRFTYWPVRIDAGGEVLAPGTEKDPVQFVDVRDLAAWLVLLGEGRTTGTFNALGSGEGVDWGSCLRACRGVCGAPAELVWAGAEEFDGHLKPGEHFPIWLSGTGETAGFHRRSNARAVEAGLKFRSVAETARGILEWWPAEIERRRRAQAMVREEAAKAGREAPKFPEPEQLVAGLSRARELEVIEAVRAARK